MPRSRIDNRGRTTLPAAVREALSLRPGDVLVYDVEARSVTLRRIDAAEVMETFATFDEWSSEADEKAYSKL